MFKFLVIPSLVIFATYSNASVDFIAEPLNPKSDSVVKVGTQERVVCTEVVEHSDFLQQDCSNIGDETTYYKMLYLKPAKENDKHVFFRHE